jgi:transposase-like protein
MMSSAATAPKSWLAQAQRVSLERVAVELGIKRTRDDRLGPCPACHETTRSHRDDRLGPLFVIRHGTRWKCDRCDAKGDALDLVSFAELERAFDEEAAPFIRTWYAVRGWCEASPEVPVLTPRTSTGTALGQGGELERTEGEATLEAALPGSVAGPGASASGDVPLKRVGRPTKCDEALITRVALLVRQGCSPNRAAKLEGVGSSTLHEWRRRAEADPGSVYAQLFNAIAHAQTEVEALAEQVVVTLLTHSDPRVKLMAARLYLERRLPEEWGPVVPESRSSESR